MPAATAIPYRDFISPGAPVPGYCAVRAALQDGAKQGFVTFKFRHRVNELTRTGDAVDGVRGEVLEPSSVERGHKSSRTVVGDFALKAQAVIVTSGGIGGDHELVRRNWPRRLARRRSG